MGKIFYVMGKSSSGKDTIYKYLLDNPNLRLNRIVMYTTRPIREGEKNGFEYFFVDEARLKELDSQGKVIELRQYDTVYGPWKYFTVNDEQIDLKYNNYIMIGTLESYVKTKKYYGENVLVPIYIVVEDGLRLDRALKREQLQNIPKYEELCRRFLADQKDFSNENLEKAEIERIFENIEIDKCINEITAYIQLQL